MAFEEKVIQERRERRDCTIVKHVYLIFFLLKQKQQKSVVKTHGSLTRSRFGKSRSILNEVRCSDGTYLFTNCDININLLYVVETLLIQ